MWVNSGSTLALTQSRRLVTKMRQGYCIHLKYTGKLAWPYDWLDLKNNLATKLLLLKPVLSEITWTQTEVNGVRCQQCVTSSHPSIIVSVLSVIEWTIHVSRVQMTLIAMFNKCHQSLAAERARYVTASLSVKTSQTITTRFTLGLF